MKYFLSIVAAVVGFLLYFRKPQKKSDEKISEIVDRQEEFEQKAKVAIDEKSVDELLTASNAALAKRRAGEGKPGKK